MPQLAPLFWLFLAIMFWSFILLVSTLLWWTQTPSTKIFTGLSHTTLTNSWKW